MGKAQRVAKRVREEYSLPNNLNIPTIENICCDRNAFVRYCPITGAQGRILFSKNSDRSIISINSNIFYQQKTKFVIAHELGHHELHKNLENFICTEDDINCWTSKKRYEYEANEFAAEFLLPIEPLKNFATGKEIGSSLIEDIASEFGASITASGIQFTKSGVVDCYFISVTNNEIDWFTWTDDFYLGEMHKGKSVPKSSNSSLFFRRGKKSSKNVQLATDWFVEANPNTYLYEDSFYLDNYGSVLSLLWICDDYN